VVLAALWLGLTLGVRPLALPDEGRYVGVAWEMLRHGDWSVPTLAGLPFFHKPPLFYWITAAALQLGGLHPGVARAASWLGAVASAVALHAFARRRAGVATARDALVVLVTMPLFFGAAQYANLDMLVAACITLAVLAFAEAVLRLDEGRPSARLRLAGWGAVGLGVLAKGLIGIVLPVLVIGLWTLWRHPRRAPRVWGHLLWGPGPLLGLALVLPWFLAMERRFDGFLDYFFVVQHFRRFSAGGFNNEQPAWFYFAVLPLLALPWSPWAAAWRHAAFWRDPQRGPLRLLMAVWLLVVVLFFSWPRSKMVGYVLPACAPLAFLLAESVHAARTRGTRGVRWAWTASVALAIVAPLLLVFVAAREQAPGGSVLAQALAAQRVPDEPVLFVDRYPYDVPMLSGIQDAWVVIDDWQNTDIARGDDWRKELADAARFAAPERAARLVSRDDLPVRLCGVRGAWVVAPLKPRPPWLGESPPTVGNARLGLWHLQATDLQRLTARAGCPQTPNDAPPSR
jgi:4-amino-4-deoxy-L-arabinose transferase-like glycosyltransferase